MTKAEWAMIPPGSADIPIRAPADFSSMRRSGRHNVPAQVVSACGLR